MRQLSLVALYGAKNSELGELIRECQQHVLAIPHIRFRPYELAQVHATIISLERLNETNYNLNFFKYRNLKKPMDFDGLLQFIRGSNYFPFRIQLGGFADRDYSFTSREQRPFERSFQISQDKVVLMGWPLGGQLKNQSYPNTLDEIRRALQKQNILHAYHQDNDDVDNDFYLRVGTVDPLSLTQETKRTLEAQIRTYLASYSPIILEITTSNVYIVSYTNNELPVGKTMTWSISDLTLTSDFMWNLLS